MIKCGKCGGEAHGLMVICGGSIHSDIPVCYQCWKHDAFPGNRYFSFMDMAKIVDRDRMEKMIPWRGPVEES